MNVVVNDDGQELVVGAVWHVRLPQADALSTVRIVDVTLHTVELEPMPRSHIRTRYEIRTVKFFDEVEQ